MTTFRYIYFKVGSGDPIQVLIFVRIISVCDHIYIYLGSGDPIQVLIFVWQAESLPQTAKELWAPPAGRLALLTTQLLL